MLTDTLKLHLDIGLVFSYLDELMEKKENPESRKRIGFKQNPLYRPTKYRDRKLRTI